MLIGGVLLIALSIGNGWIFSRLFLDSKQTNLDSDIVFLMLLFWTKCCLFFVLGVFNLATLTNNWHGDANRMLLLKLLDEQTKNSHETAHSN